MRISKILILASLTTAFGCAADDSDDTGAGTGTDPATTDPATTDPVTTDPVTTDPVTTDPVTTDPVTTDPVTTDPVTTDPTATDSTESSGTDPDTGSTGGDANCELYCSVFLVTCQDGNGGLDDADPYVDMDDCMTVCGGFELGMEGDMAGNTLGCRGYHLGVATMVMDAGHCSHADADGTGVCV